MSGFVYQLRWNNFPGRVPARADVGTTAFVSTRFRADAPWTYDGNDGSRVCSISSVSTTVSVNRSSMWARTGAARSPSVLVHEQGHFEITALIEQTWSREADVNQAIRDARDPLFQIINDLQSQASGDGTYDTSTNHGMHANQAAWNHAFAACRAAASRQLVAALSAQGISI